MVEPERTAATACGGVLDRNLVGDVDAELSGGHELHRTPQVASDERGSTRLNAPRLKPMTPMPRSHSEVVLTR